MSPHVSGMCRGRYFSMHQMALSSVVVASPSLHSNTLLVFPARCSQGWYMRHVCRQVRAQAQGQLQYKKLGDSDLLISEVTLGTVRTKPSSLPHVFSEFLDYSLSQMTFGEQNTEKEAHDQLSFSFDQGVNILDTAEIVSTDCFLSFISYFSYL
jgi:hypothetical protein